MLLTIRKDFMGAAEKRKQSPFSGNQKEKRSPFTAQPYNDTWHFSIPPLSSYEVINILTLTNSIYL